MRYQGKVTSWNEDRGFGFIEWNGGSDKVFVHISAFNTRHRRPATGDIVTYEVTKDANGRHQAINVGFAGAPKNKTSTPRSNTRLPWSQGLVLVVLAAIGVGMYLQRAPESEPAKQSFALQSSTAKKSPYQCAGKTHCSEMTSCDEATFYIRNCPGTEMDGDRDGIPCESQWCRY